jgi:hypothetical protein
MQNLASQLQTMGYNDQQIDSMLQGEMSANQATSSQLLQENAQTIGGQEAFNNENITQNENQSQWLNEFGNQSYSALSAAGQGGGMSDANVKTGISGGNAMLGSFLDRMANESENDYRYDVGEMQSQSRAPQATPVPASGGSGGGGGSQGGMSPQMMQQMMSMFGKGNNGAQGQGAPAGASSPAGASTPASNSGLGTDNPYGNSAGSPDATSTWGAADTDAGLATDNPYAGSGDMGGGGMGDMGGGDMGGMGDMGGGDMSDETKKKDIERPDDSDVEHFLDHLNAWQYQYKNPEQPGAGYGTYVSPMAQEMEKSDLGKNFVQNTPQGKMVNYAKMSGTLLAAQAMQHQAQKETDARIDRLEKRKGR